MKDFQIVKLIGKGSFGSIYKVKNVNDKKSYAMKKIHVSRQNREDSKATLSEIHILYHSDCPFILKYNTCYYDLSYVCIVTKYCKNKDLLYKINDLKKNNEYFTEDQVWTIFIQVCYGIYYLHSNNVIHRDLKTANIFVEGGDDFKIQIGDFGVSKVLNNADTTNTQIGTPLYLSPEIVTNHKYGKKTDIWSLGCVLYEILTLKSAFTARSMSALCRKIVVANYPKIINTNNYSEDILELLDKMLVLDKIKRISIHKLLSLKQIKEKIHLVPKYDLSKVPDDDIPEFENPLTNNAGIVRRTGYSYNYRNRYHVNQVPWNKLLEKYKFPKENKSTLVTKPNFKSKYDIIPAINPDINNKTKINQYINNKKEIPKLDRKNASDSINIHTPPKLNTHKPKASRLTDKLRINSKLNNIKNRLDSKSIRHRHNQLPAIHSLRNSNINNSYSNNIINNRNKQYHRNRNNNNNWGNKEPNGNYVLTNNIYNSPDPIIGGYRYRRDNMVMKIGSRHDPTYSKFNF